MEEYKVSFVPVDCLTYDFVVAVDNDNEDEAYDKGKESLREAIGYDSAKDWTCSDIVKITKENNNGKK